MATKSKKASKPAKKATAKKPASGKKAKPSAKKVKPAPKKAVKKVVAKAKPKSKPKPIAKKVVVKSKPASKRPATKSAAKPAPAASHKHHEVKIHHPKKEDSNKTRYSDRDLQEFKNLIDEKLEAAKNELKYLNDQINRKGDNGTDDTENKFATMEDGTVAMEREYLTQMSSRQAQYIDHLEKALTRIQNKTYGVCRVTGKLIDRDRLRAVPHATLSMEAKMMMNK
jgi:RNA polymerase-binding transcription factor DksA